MYYNDNNDTKHNAHTYPFQLSLPITTVYAYPATYSLCTHIRGTESMYHNYDWINYHLRLGFQYIHVSDRYGSMRKLLEPYIQSGSVIYRHAPIIESEVAYAYDQIIEMEICKNRLYHTTQWIGHWDTDKWLSVPIIQPDNYNNTATKTTHSARSKPSLCQSVEPLSSSELNLYKQTLNQYGYYRNYTEYPVYKLQSVRPHIYNTNMCPSVLHNYMLHYTQQLQLEQLEWTNSLQYEVILIPSMPAYTQNITLIQHNKQIAESTKRQQQEVLHDTTINTTTTTITHRNVYSPLYMTYPYIQHQFSQPKWMSHVRIRADNFVHYPLWPYDVQQTMIIPGINPLSNQSALHLTHYANYYKDRNILNEGQATLDNNLINVWQSIQIH